MVGMRCYPVIAVVALIPTDISPAVPTGPRLRRYRLKMKPVVNRNRNRHRHNFPPCRGAPASRPSGSSRRRGGRRGRRVNYSRRPGQLDSTLGVGARQRRATHPTGNRSTSRGPSSFSGAPFGIQWAGSIPNSYHADIRTAMLWQRILQRASFRMAVSVLAQLRPRTSRANHAERALDQTPAVVVGQELVGAGTGSSGTSGARLPWPRPAGSST